MHMLVGYCAFAHCVSIRFVMMQMCIPDIIVTHFITIRTCTQKCVPIGIIINKYTQDTVMFYKRKDEYVHTG